MYDSILRFLLLAAIYGTGLMLILRPWRSTTPQRAAAPARRTRG